ncbi:MAG TPA: hypothetical protein VKY31_14630 [Terriglobia bacterium]|nr:hypothetical protein [Terriglobia bacterium]
MTLKPQDVVVAIKLAGRHEAQRPSFAQIGLDLKMSASEVHAAVKRCQSAHLLGPHELGDRPNRRALEEFLIHGIKYAFPAERGEPTRGVPTGYAAPPLNKFIAAGDELPPVWPYPEGLSKGISFEPLYKTVPFAALHDEFLYECLALVDALRDGRVREKQIAERELRARLKSA